MLGSAEACEARWECSQPVSRAPDLAIPRLGLLHLMVRAAIPGGANHQGCTLCVLDYLHIKLGVLVGACIYNYK